MESVLKEKLAKLSSAERARLLAKLQKQDSSVDQVSSLTGRESFRYRASHQQRYFWTLHHVLENQGSLNCKLGLKLTGEFDVERLKRAFAELARRHDIYRTTYVDGADGLQAIVHAELPPEIVELEAEEKLLEGWRDHFLGEINRPLDIESTAPFRLSYCRYSDSVTVLFICFHHISCDGGTWNLFWSELLGIYREDDSVSEQKVLSSEIQYSAYAERRNQALEYSGGLLDAWGCYYQDLPKPKIPQTYALPAKQKISGCRVLIPLSSGEWQRIGELASKWGSTRHNVLFAAFFAWHFRYADAEDLAIGTPINLRMLTGDDKVHGCSVNTLSIRAKMEAEMAFSELHDAVARDMQAMMGRADVPVITLMEKMGVEEGRNLGLHQAVFQLRNIVAEMEPLDAEGTSELLIPNIVNAQMPLLCEVYPKEDHGVLSLIYDPKKYQSFEGQSMLQAYRVLINNLLDEPDSKLQDLPLVDEVQYSLLTQSWARNAKEYPHEKSVWEVFCENVETYPDQPALKSDELILTYAEVKQKADRLAQGLLANGVQRGDRVCIYFERSPEMIISTLAILSIGAAYVPLDVEYPLSRIGYIIENAEAALTLTHAPCFGRLKNEQILASTYEDLISNHVGNGRDIDAVREAAAVDVAYLIYTSGTTGNPKGSLILNRGIVRLVKEADYAKFGSDEVYLQLASPSFDAATFEIWAPLLNGGTLVLMPVGMPTLKDIEEVIQRYGVTTLWLTAGLFHAAVDQSLTLFGGMRQLLTGGDTLSPSHIEKLKTEHPALRVINGYGPTENTTFSCCHTISEDFDSSLSVSIGKPIANSEAYILDEKHRPLPVGVAGELYLGGDGLTSGYWKRPELNAQAFIAHPFDQETEKKLYKTGDSARYRADGTIEFLGRKDNQVKVRGFRVELSEIEKVIESLDAIESCCAFIPERGSKVIHVAVVTVSGEKALGDIRRAARAVLPQYMMPESWHVLDELPLTQNGKVDRKALLLLEAEGSRSVRELALPSSIAEQRIYAIWVRMFESNDIDVLDNFFDLGGNSLLAMRLVAELDKEFDQRITLSLLFKCPTIKALAEIVSEDLELSSTVVPLLENGDCPNLFMVHGWGGDVFSQIDFVRHMPDSLNVYGIQSVEHTGDNARLSSFEEMAERYIQDMLEVQPEGPFYLCGFSLGGSIAFEIARQLRTMGHAVGQLFLFDTISRNIPKGIFYRAHMPYYIKRVAHHLKSGVRGSEEGRRTYLKKRVNALKNHLGWRKVHAEAAVVTGKSNSDVEVAAWSDYYAVLNEKYYPQPSDVGVTVYMAEGNTWNMRAIWHYLSKGNVTVVQAHSDHLSMFKDKELAAHLARSIEKFSAT